MYFFKITLTNNKAGMYDEYDAYLKQLGSMFGECEILENDDETWWNYFQVSGKKKELRNIWLNSGEGQSRVTAKDTVCTKN